MITGSDVVAGRSTVAELARVTPVRSARWLSELVQAPVWLKCENLQRAGSFKVRGAYLRLSRMTNEERARGVVTASAGNHAQGMSVAAQALGTVRQRADESGLSDASGGLSTSGDNT